MSHQQSDSVNISTFLWRDHTFSHNFLFDSNSFSQSSAFILVAESLSYETICEWVSLQTKVTAERIIKCIDGETPWLTPSDFLRALAAHSSLYADELKRRTHQNGVSLTKLLHNAAKPSRMQWLFNNLRRLHALPVAQRHLLATGTTANEAFHHEINSWFKNQSDIFSSTVQLQLSVAILGKQLSHCSSLYFPTLRQLRQHDVLSAVVASLEHPLDPWTDCCDSLRREGSGLRKSELPLALERKKLAARIRGAAKKPAGVQVRILKRPARQALHVRKRPAGCTKRTAFTLSRPESLARVRE